MKILSREVRDPSVEERISASCANRSLDVADAVTFIMLPKGEGGGCSYEYARGTIYLINCRRRINKNKELHLVCSRTSGPVLACFGPLLDKRYKLLADINQSLLFYRKIKRPYLFRD